MKDSTGCTLICSACGYQWDETSLGEPANKSGSTFFMDCPVCEANLVHRYSPEKEEIMGDDYDGQPWF